MKYCYLGILASPHAVKVDGFLQYHTVWAGVLIWGLYVKEFCDSFSSNKKEGDIHRGNLMALHSCLSILSEDCILEIHHDFPKMFIEIPGPSEYPLHNKVCDELNRHEWLIERKPYDHLLKQTIGRCGELIQIQSNSLSHQVKTRNFRMGLN